MFYCPPIRPLLDTLSDLSLIKYQPIAVSVVNREYRLFLLLMQWLESITDLLSFVL